MNQVLKDLEMLTVLYDWLVDHDLDHAAAHVEKLIIQVTLSLKSGATPEPSA